MAEKTTKRIEALELAVHGTAPDWTAELDDLIGIFYNPASTEEQKTAAGKRLTEIIPPGMAQNMEKVYGDRDEQHA